MLSSEYMLYEFKKYLCPLYIVFSTAQKKKASHHHPLGELPFCYGTLIQLWVVRGKKFCGGQCRMTLFIIMMSWFFFCFPQFNSSGARVGMQACFKLFYFGLPHILLLLINETSRNERSFLWYLPLFWPVRQSRAAEEHKLSLSKNTPISWYTYCYTYRYT